MRIPWCRANATAIPDWMAENCNQKQCPHIVYMCEQDIVDTYRKQGGI